MEAISLMAARAARPDDEPDSEPVLVEIRGTNLAFVLDDGEEIIFDATELLATIAALMAPALREVA